MMAVQVPTNIAYRIYPIESGWMAIAFNISSREYMFLKGLSAELLLLILTRTDSELESWCISKGVTNEDLTQFIAGLSKFGFFASSRRESENKIEKRDSEWNEDCKPRPDLNLFQKELRKNGFYYSFHIDLTNRCNEKCVHCYHPFDKYDYSKELSLDEIKHLIDMIYDLGVFSVTLSGGECLLRKDFFDVLAYVSDKGMMTTIFTNGMLLTESVVERLKKYRVKLVSISLYGDMPKVHDRITGVEGSFHRTIEGIERLKRAGLFFELKCMVLAENVDRIESVRRLSKELNYGRDCKVDFALCGQLDGNCVVLSHQAPQASVKKMFFSDPERYFYASTVKARKPDELPCGAGKFGFYCSADGGIYPCVSFRLLLCNYGELPQIASNEVLHNWFQVRLRDFKDCFRHDYCNYCTGQCAGNNLIENGDYLDSTDVSTCTRAKIISDWFKANLANNAVINEGG